MPSRPNRPWEGSRITPRILITALAATAALAAASAPAFAQSEPNDTLATANGPLASDVPYSGALETSNDLDYYVFWVDDTRQVFITFTNTSQSTQYPGCSNKCKSWEGIYLQDADGELIASTDAMQGEPAKTLAQTVTRGRYHILVRSSESYPGATYTFTVSAPGGLVSGDCLAAQDRTARYTKELAGAKKRLGKTRGAAKRSRVKRTITSLNGALNKARQQQTATCG